jgi:hypothetical protein
VKLFAWGFLGGWETRTLYKEKAMFKRLLTILPFLFTLEGVNAQENWLAFKDSTSITTVERILAMPTTAVGFGRREVDVYGSKAEIIGETTLEIVIPDFDIDLIYTKDDVKSKTGKFGLEKIKKVMDIIEGERALAQKK